VAPWRRRPPPDIHPRVEPRPDTCAWRLACPAERDGARRHVDRRRRSADGRFGQRRGHRHGRAQPPGLDRSSDRDRGSTAGVEILIPVDTRAPAIGTRVRVEGTIGRAYDAPRIKAERIVVVAAGARPLALDLQRAPSAAHEWRLVRISGTVDKVTKLGDRWRADVSVGPDRVAVSGLAGAGISSTALVEGRTARIVGIVRRPYPGATDRRWSIAPRSPADIVSGAAPGTAPTTREPDDPPAGPGAAGPGSGLAGDATQNVDLVELGAHVGKLVRVGGLVAELVPEGFLLDDGTAIGTILLHSEAAAYLPLIEPGDALNATGLVEQDGAAFRIVVDDPAGLVRVGDPTLDPTTGGISEEWASPSPTGPPETAGRLAGGLLGPDVDGTAGLLGIFLVSSASVAVTVLRRQRARRLLAARVATRLARLAATPEATHGATHGPDR